MIRKRVAVIGAGAAGLVAAKLSLEEGFEVEVFEQTSSVGGTWVYSDERGCHSSMYHVLKTNLPKEAMLFRDKPFKEALPSFMSHEDVLEYLEEYSKGLPIFFNHTVTKVERNEPIWEVTVDNGTKVITKSFDVVFVCNGHYFLPNNPYENSDFEGRLIHSHDYRRAAEFAGQDVVVIGAGPSGIDIALQLADVCKKVTLISKKAVYPNLPDNIEQAATHVRCVSRRGCETEDGRNFNADSIVVCTGYHFKFPFLSPDLIQLKADSQMVSPVFEHVVHAKYPRSLFFIGLNLVAITFPLFEYQVRFSLAYVTGRAEVPSEEELLGWEQKQLDHQLLRGFDARFYHFLQIEQWDYLARLAKLGNFDHWDYMKVMRKMFDYLFDVRKTNAVGYKNINFLMNEDQTDFQVIDIPS